MRKNDRQARTETLTAQFIAANRGIPICTMKQAGGMLQVSYRVIQRLVSSGDLVVTRTAHSGGMALIQCAELARWFVDGEERFRRPRR